MLSHEIPDRPWCKIGIDIFNFGGSSYIAIMDYYSKWIEFKHLSDKSIKEVIKRLREIFASFGFPDQIVCDNVPFNSYMFRDFTNKYDNKIIHSSPNKK